MLPPRNASFRALQTLIASSIRSTTLPLSAVGRETNTTNMVCESSLLIGGRIAESNGKCLFCAHSASTAIFVLPFAFLQKLIGQKSPKSSFILVCDLVLQVNYWTYHCENQFTFLGRAWSDCSCAPIVCILSNYTLYPPSIRSS